MSFLEHSLFIFFNDFVLVKIKRSGYPLQIERSEIHERHKEIIMQ